MNKEKGKKWVLWGAWLAIFLLVTQARGNMRGPHRVENGPSPSLLVPAEGLTVLEESLWFDFEEATATVTAEYKIHCEQTGEHVFEFILPAQLGLKDHRTRVMCPAELQIKAEAKRGRADACKIQYSALAILYVTTPPIVPITPINLRTRPRAPPPSTRHCHYEGIRRGQRKPETPPREHHRATGTRTPYAQRLARAKCVG